MLQWTPTQHNNKKHEKIKFKKEENAIYILAHINYTKGFYCDISMNAYSVL
jgi:hypothetical protein